MMPVVIEEDLDLNTQGKYPFLEAIRSQVIYPTDEACLIDDELLISLLQRRRILVILERFSQLSEKTRHAIESEIANFPINALVITASTEDTLKMLPKLPFIGFLCADIWR